MLTKTFTKNDNNKIEFSENELKELLDEIYRYGYNEGKGNKIYHYTTPYRWNSNWPYWTYTTTSTPITINNDNITTCDSTTIKVKGENK